MNLTHYPLLLFALSFFVLALSAWTGVWLAGGRRAIEDEEREEFGVVQSATLTLLGLIVGFTFSMALGRYDLRKNYEEAEANAIGTEYLRADLLPAAEAAKVRALLLKYLDQRVLFYGNKRCTAAFADQYPNCETAGRAVVYRASESQLLAFAQGMRQNDISEQMRTIATQSAPEEMYAVAAYYGGGL
jgi:hypothetical protein